MKIEVIEKIPHPADVVLRTLRDELVGLVEFLPNIDAIEQIEREEAGPGRTRIANRWKARSEIPTVARAIVKPEMLQWVDHADWDEEASTCGWRLEMGFFPERISCEGKTTYKPIDETSTEMAVRGELSIDVKGMKGVPRLLAGKVGAGVEKFVVSLITPNYRKLNEGLVSYLAKK